MPKLTNKKKRQALLDQQDHRCGLCGAELSNSKNSCYDDQHNTFNCRSCAQFINVSRSLFARGVTFEMLIAYEEREPQSVAPVKSDRRLCVEEGRLLYDGPNNVPGGRRFLDWAEALDVHPEWAEAERKLNA